MDAKGRSKDAGTELRNRRQEQKQGCGAACFRTGAEDTSGMQRSSRQTSTRDPMPSAHSTSMASRPLSSVVTAQQAQNRQES